MTVLRIRNGAAVPPVSDKTDLLDVLQTLKERIESGQVVAFAAAAIDANDACYGFAGADKAASVSRLRVQGAISQLLHDYIAGELDE